MIKYVAWIHVNYLIMYHLIVVFVLTI